MTNLELKTEITKDLKRLPNFVSCIAPDHLSSYNDTILLSVIQYSGLIVRVIQVTSSFYIIAYQSSKYKWSQITDTAFDIRRKVEETLKNPKPKTNRLFN